MFKIIQIILKRKRYLMAAVLPAIFSAALSYFLTVINVSGKSIQIYAVMNGVGFTVLTLLFSAIIAILFGLYIALLLFTRDLKKIKAMNNNLTASGGGIAGIIASGCPSCGSPILGFFGAPLGLLVLPFRGLEIKLLSILLLFFSVYSITKNIKNHLLCELKK